jgi:hypothetical protein
LLVLHRTLSWKGHAFSASRNQDDIVSAVPNPSSQAPAGPWTIELREAGPSILFHSPSTISFSFPADMVTLVRFGLAMVVAGLTAVWVTRVQYSRQIRMAFLVGAIGIMAVLAVQLRQ